MSESPLSAEDRQRIEAEERLRHEIRIGLSKKSDAWIWWAIGTPVAILVCLWLIGCFMIGLDVSRTSAPAAATTATTTRFACLCALQLDSVASVMRAYNNSDMEAIAGLYLRGKAIKLTAGTRVEKLTATGHGVSSVLVKSGKYTGESCWLLDTFAQ